MRLDFPGEATLRKPFINIWDAVRGNTGKIMEALDFLPLMAYTY